MSNLVKQYYVVEPEAKTRIINNNKLIDEKLKEYENKSEFKRLDVDLQPIDAEEECFQEDDNETTEDNEFVDGIEASVVETVDKDSMVEDIIKKANERAESIVEVANKNAEVIIQKANEQAELIYEEKRKEGYEDGAFEKNQEIEHLRSELEEEFAKRKAELESDFEDYTSRLEVDLIDALTQVFDKVFHIQFDDKKEMLLHLVKNTISKIEVGREFRIHVSQSNYKFILAHIDEIRERIGNDVEIEIVNDANLESSDCQIETSFGVFDCGIDMELNNLIKDIKSLCS